MTKIKDTNAYPIKQYPNNKDYFIGTDAENGNRTVNFSFETVSNMILGNIEYIFSMSSLPLLSPTGNGYFITNGIVDFTIITELQISKINLSGVDLTPLMNFLKNNTSDFTLNLVSKSNKNVFAYYKLNSIIESTDYFTFNIGLAPGNNYLGQLVDKDVYSFNYDLISSIASFPVASETSPGIVQLATPAETIAGTNNTKAVHPFGLASALLNYQKALTLTTNTNSGASTLVGGALNIPRYDFYVDSKIEDQIVSGVLDKTSSQNAIYEGLFLKADKTTLINTLGPLQGGGDLSDDRNLSIAKASASQDGYLSAADWITFNSKPNVAGTVTEVFALTIGTTGNNITSSVVDGTTTPKITLNIPDASATSRGVLSTSDWINFNSKQSTSLLQNNIFVGNALNVATGVLLSGDANITSAGILTNTGLYGRPITLATGFFKFDGTDWIFDANTYALDSNVLHKTGNESRTGNLTISNLVTPSALLLQNGGSSAGILSIVNVSTFPAFTGTTGSAGTLAALNTTDTGTVLSLNSSSTGKLLSGLNNNIETSSLDKFGKFIGSSADFSGNVTGATPTASNHLVTKAYADNLVVGLLNLRGSYDASSNLYPTTGGSGTAGAIRKGDLWYVSVAGTLSGKLVNVGDSFVALLDSPGQTFTNWNVMESNIGYVPADDANVIHITGDESKTGRLSVTASSSSPTFTGQSNVGVGVYGLSSSNYGVTGTSTTGGGIFGNSTSGIGVSAGSISGIGLRTNNSTGNTSDLAQFAVNGSILSKIDYLGNITGNSFIKTGGLATQFLKADGSIDSTAYAALASPAFTGVPTAPTATSGTNTTQIATTAFVTGNFVTLNTAQNITATKNMTQINIVRSASDFNGINITGQRSGANAGLIDISSTTEGFAFKYVGSGSSIGFTGVSTSGGPIFQGISSTGATGNIFQGTDGVLNVFTVNRLGNGYFAGNVGIGTSAPAVKLDVRGKFIVANNDFTFPSTGSLIQIDQGATSGNTYSRIGAFSSGGTVSNNLILNSEGGNVGIARINPTFTLDVKGGDSNGIRYEGASGVQTILGCSPTTAQVGTVSNHDLDILLNSALAIKVKASGDVAIGGLVPKTKLDVFGGISSTAAGNPYFRLYSTDSNVNNRNWDFLTNLGNFGDFDLRVSTAQGLDPGVSLIKVKSNGSIGFGTTSPISGVLLTLKESATNASALALVNRNNTQTWVFANDLASIDDGKLSFYNQTLGGSALTLNPDNSAVFSGSISALSTSSGYSALLNKTSGFGSSLALKNSSTSSESLLRFLTPADAVVTDITNNATNDGLVFSGTIETKGISNHYTANGVTDIFNAMKVASSFNSSGDNSLDAPFSSDFYFLESFKYDSAAFGMQRITYFTGSVAGRMFIRTKTSDIWSAWVEK